MHYEQVFGCGGAGALPLAKGRPLDIDKSFAFL
jgi:hypothetical protein